MTWTELLEWAEQNYNATTVIQRVELLKMVDVPIEYEPGYRSWFQVGVFTFRDTGIIEASLSRSPHDDCITEIIAKNRTPEQMKEIINNMYGK